MKVSVSIMEKIANAVDKTVNLVLGLMICEKLGNGGALPNKGVDAPFARKSL